MREITTGNNEYSGSAGFAPYTPLAEPAHQSVGGGNSEITAPPVFDAPPDAVADIVPDAPPAPLPGVQEGPQQTIIEGTKVWTANGFYRIGHHHVAALGGVVAPAMMAGRPAGEQFTVLDAGCSQGKDTWSLASVLAHHGVPFHIDAFDANSLMIKRAQEPYRTTYEKLVENIMWYLPEVPVEVVDYFEPVDANHIRPTEALRERVAFHVANLLHPFDTPQQTYDAVVCNNVFMHYTRDGEVQNAAVEQILQNTMAKLKVDGIFTFTGGWASEAQTSLTLGKLGLVKGQNDYGISPHLWYSMKMYRKVREPDL